MSKTLGEESREYRYGDTEIIDTLIHDEGVKMARELYREGVSTDTYVYHFGIPDAVREFGDVASKGDWSTSFLGGYDVTITDVFENDAYNIVDFRVENITGWNSATRIWGFSFKQDEFRPEFGPGGTLKQIYSWRERIPK